MNADFKERLFPPEEIRTRVVGVTFGDKMADGAPARQVYLSLMRNNGSSKIKLEPEPDNPYDPYAIKVMGDWGEGWKQLGYISNKERVCSKCGKSVSYSKTEECQDCGGELTRNGLATAMVNWFNMGFLFNAKVYKYIGSITEGESLGCLLTITYKDGESGLDLK